MSERSNQALKVTTPMRVRRGSGTRPAAVSPPQEAFSGESTPLVGGHGLASAAANTSEPSQAGRDRGTLLLVQGPECGRVHPVSPNDPVVLGRSEECTLSAVHPTVSRRHARVWLESGHYWVEDLGSANGTFVNGEPVTERRVLRMADQIQLGAMIRFRFDLHTLQEQQVLTELYRSAVRDPLTGLYNREHFEDRLAAEVSYAARNGSELAMIMVDIDHFKDINDTHGHPAGDAALRVLARNMERMLRPEDLLARVGGEEFAVVARGLDVRNAMILAERIRNRVEGARLRWGGEQLELTVSVGVASLACLDEALPERLVAAADEAMYAAKGAGRNRSRPAS